MPTYEYECQNCSFRFEVKKRFGENSGASCPQCQGEACRIFLAVPIMFKGPGFYVTDSKTREGRRSDNGRDKSSSADLKND